MSVQSAHCSNCGYRDPSFKCDPYSGPVQPRVQNSTCGMRHPSGSVAKLAAVAGSVLLPVVGNIVFSSVSRVLGAKETFLDIAKTFYGSLKNDTSKSLSFFGRLGAAWKATVEAHGASTVYGHAGGLAGSFVGFLIGLAAPPFGWMVGSLIGAALGTLLGNVLAERAEEKDAGADNKEKESDLSPANFDDEVTNEISRGVERRTESLRGQGAGDEGNMYLEIKALNNNQK